MDRPSLQAWLRLTLTDGVGSVHARKLLAAFGSPELVFAQSELALRQVVSPALAESLLQPPATLQARVQATWDWLHEPAKEFNRHIAVLGERCYLAALLEMDDPPVLLYLQGGAPSAEDPQANCDAAEQAMAAWLASFTSSALAIVGSRNPTPQGLINARNFGCALASAGLTIVSGLAHGVDGAAHEGALQAVAGAAPRLVTIAVVGTGLDRVYPKEHKALAHRIAQNGLLVSEYPLGTGPLAANFPRRNRIIAGLSQGTLVVEAALKSGSLITARLAVEQGKEVFAIPGSIHSTQARGCHALIKQGAKLVESAQDILEELQLSSTAPARPVPSANVSAPAQDSHQDSAEHVVIAALGYDPVGLDALQARCGLSTATLQATLMTLELDGVVSRLPGGLFQRLTDT